MVQDVAGSWGWVDAAPLSSAEEQVLREVFWRLLSGDPVAPATVARSIGLPRDAVDEAIAALEAQRCLRRTVVDGSVVAARGLITQPSRHRLVTDEGTVFTQCAVDAIAIPGALGIAGRVEDSCPVCERHITITVGQDRELGVAPPPAVVVMARAERAADCCDESGIPTMCNETNLFCCSDHAASWQGETATLENVVVTPIKALEAGRPLWRRFARRDTDAGPRSERQ